MHRRPLTATLAAATAAVTVVGVLLFSAFAEARCAPVSLPNEVRQSPFIVEAVVERAGDPAQLRTVAVWKGGASAPTTFTLSARRGRGTWPWAEPAGVGQRFVLFLQPNGGSFGVRRCGSTGPATEALRAELRGRGLRSQSR